MSEIPITQQNPHYQRVGGEAGIRRLVERFYELMDTLPEAYGIRKMHAQDLSASKEKLFMFLSGWLGGPQLYTEQFGHPRLRQRHLPFPIGEAERDQWLLCMNQAMEDVGLEPELRAQLAAAFHKTADFMRNREG
ncbi:MAG: group II truncated hemoglobin [Sulfuricellaceae bacterium]|jgi:hemoglobin